MFLDRIDRRADEDGLVADDLRVEVCGQRRLNLCQPLLDAIGDADGVLPRLFGDDQRDRRLTIQISSGALLFGFVGSVTYITQLDGVSAARRHGDVIELFGIGDAAHGAHSKFARAFFDASAGHFHVLLANGIDDIGDRDVVSAHAVGIDPDMYLAFLAAENLHLADAVDGFDALLDLLVGNLCDIAQ